MIYNFVSIDEFIFSFEKELVDVLYDYSLLTKFSLDSKKILFYFFFNKLNEVLTDHKTLLYHNHVLNSKHEILQYYPEKDLNIFINKICSKTKKLTNRLIFIKSDKSIPERTPLKDLDGEVIDQVILMNNKSPSNMKDLKKFLENINLGEMFKTISFKLS